MNQDLGHDEQRKGQEETRLRFQVLQERESTPATACPSRADRTRSGSQVSRGRARTRRRRQIEGRLRQPAAQEELVQRPAQDEREVGGVGGFHRRHFGLPTHEYCHAAEAIL